MNKSSFYIFLALSNIFLLITKIEAQPSSGFSLQTSFNHEDVSVGFDWGILNEKKNGYFFMTFESRPYKKRVLIKDNSGTWYQFSEYRYFIGLGGELYKMFKGSNAGAFIQLSGGYSWANYAGTKRTTEDGFTLVPRTGFLLRFPGEKTDVNLKLGYGYFNPMHNSISSHRVYVGFTIFHNKQ